MGIWTKIVGLLMLGSAAALPAQSINYDIPPEHRNAPVQTVPVEFYETYWEVGERCGNRDPFIIFFACYLPGSKKLVLPNPCSYPEAQQKGTYAHLVCHENAHVNGWRH